MSKSYKQLITNVEGEVNEFYPKQLIGNVLDDDTGENLYAYLSKFNHINVGKQSSPYAAFNAVPSIYRKHGFYITYTIDKDCYTKFFDGSDKAAGTDAWTDIRNWKIADGTGEVATHSITLSQLSKEVLDIIGANRHTNIINYPDGEDLTQFEICGKFPKSKVHALRFADKDYNHANFSGLGRKFLRKHIVKVTDADGNTFSINHFTQDMINKENTIYVIQYDYDLNGETITIPNNSILDFKGGSLSNGYVVYNGATIDASRIKNSVFYFSTVHNRPLWWNGAYWVTWADNVEIDGSLMQLYYTIDSSNIEVYIVKDEDKYYLVSNDSEDNIDASSETTKDELLNVLNRDYSELFNITDVKVYVSDGTTNTILSRKADLVEDTDGITLKCDIISISIKNDDTASVTLDL